MLTIEIPKSNRRKSEEDALASFILSEIKEKGECVYFHYGVGWGNNWPHCWAKNTGSDAKAVSYTHLTLPTKRIV